MQGDSPQLMADPKRDLTDLERIARTYKVGMSMHHFERPCAWACDGWVGWLISVNQDGNWFLNPSNPEGDGESCNFAEALALLKGAGDGKSESQGRRSAP